MVDTELVFWRLCAWSVFKSWNPQPEPRGGSQVKREYGPPGHVSKLFFKELCNDGANAVGSLLHAILRDSLGDDELVAISEKFRVNGW